MADATYWAELWPGQSTCDSVTLKDSEETAIRLEIDNLDRARLRPLVRGLTGSAIRDAIIEHTDSAHDVLWAKGELGVVRLENARRGQPRLGPGSVRASEFPEGDVVAIGSAIYTVKPGRRPSKHGSSQAPQSEPMDRFRWKRTAIFEEVTSPERSSVLAARDPREWWRILREVTQQFGCGMSLNPPYSPSERRKTDHLPKFADNEVVRPVNRKHRR